MCLGRGQEATQAESLMWTTELRVEADLLAEGQLMAGLCLVQDTVLTTDQAAWWGIKGTSD